MDWSPDGPLVLATGSDDGTARLWAVEAPSAAKLSPQAEGEGVGPANEDPLVESRFTGPVFGPANLSPEAPERMETFHNQVPQEMEPNHQGASAEDGVIIDGHMPAMCAPIQLQKNDSHGAANEGRQAGTKSDGPGVRPCNKGAGGAENSAGAGTDWDASTFELLNTGQALILTVGRDNATKAEAEPVDELAERAATLRWRRSRLTSSSAPEEAELVEVEERVLCLQHQHRVSPFLSTC